MSPNARANNPLAAQAADLLARLADLGNDGNAKAERLCWRALARYRRRAGFGG
jgi:hypothetical protein